MAKAKTTTRGKTKTAKKTAAAKTASPKLSSQKSLIKQLRLLHAANLVIAIVGIITTFIVLPRVVYPLTLSYQVRDVLANGKEAFLPAERIWFEVDLRWIIAAMLVTLGAYSLLVLSRWQKSYEKGVSSGIYFWRWAFMAVGGTLLAQIVALVSGVEDALTLKLIGGAVVLSAGLSWLAERQNEKARKPVYSAFGLAVLAGLLPLLAIGQYLLSTVVYGMVNLQWYNYALAVVALIAFGFTGLNQLMKYRGEKRWKDNNFVELNYLATTLATKLALVVILLFAFS